jgi:hypothetical protein
MEKKALVLDLKSDELTDEKEVILICENENTEVRLGNGSFEFARLKYLLVDQSDVRKMSHYLHSNEVSFFL